MNYKYISYIFICTLFIQCKPKQEFKKNFYSKNIGLRNQSLKNIKEVMISNNINNNILDLRYYELKNDTTQYEYDLTAAKSYAVKEITLNGNTKEVYKYFWTKNDIPDSDIEIFLTDEKKVLIIKDISWVMVHSFFKDDNEKQLIELLLKDTTGFLISHCLLYLQNQ